MNGQVFPLFEQVHILRVAMLTELRDYAFEFGRLLYEECSDGIVGGCNITTTTDTISLNRGVIRYNGQMYLIVEPITLFYQPTDNWTVFKLGFKDESRRHGYIYREVEAAISGDMSLGKSEMEVCRFKLKHGARLRIKYVDFEDRNTEFDTVNTIRVPYAAVGKSSISPVITRAFAEEAMACRTEPLDDAFLMQALNAHMALSRDLVLFYIAARRKKPYADCSNEEIFAALREILQELKNGGKREITRPVRERRQIIVD